MGRFHGSTLGRADAGGLVTRPDSRSYLPPIRRPTHVGGGPREGRAARSRRDEQMVTRPPSGPGVWTGSLLVLGSFAVECPAHELAGPAAPESPTEPAFGFRGLDLGEPLRTPSRGVRRTQRMRCT